jgi:hypothetical protein
MARGRPRAARARRARSTRAGVGRSPSAGERSKRTFLSPSRSVVRRSRSGSSGSGSSTRSSRWNVPPPAAVARSVTMADTMLPAAPVTTHTRSGRGRDPRLRRDLAQAHAQAESPRRPTSTTPGSASASSRRASATAAGSSVHRHVEHLHESRRAAPEKALVKPLVPPPMGWPSRHRRSRGRHRCGWRSRTPGRRRGRRRGCGQRGEHLHPPADASRQPSASSSSSGPSGSSAARANTPSMPPARPAASAAAPPRRWVHRAPCR